MELWLIATKVL